MNSSITNKKIKETTYGRPRLLSHEEILESAVELGLEGLTMKRLANQLNVGTATLYQYFDSRKSLMRAAAVYSLSDLPLPVDTGQHWSKLSTEYVSVIQDLLAENPSFIHSYQHTDYGFEVQFQLIEKFLSSMSKRYFTPKKGMELFNIIGMVAFAGAIEITRQREFEYNDESMKDVAKRQFSKLNKKEFPYMTDALCVFTQEPQSKLELLLTATFKSIARERGEDESEISVC
jgi:AcrR family transcriptional regulator